MTQRIATNSSVTKRISYHLSYCNHSTISKSIAWFTTRKNLSSLFPTAIIQDTIWATTARSLSILPLSHGLIMAKSRKNATVKLTASGWMSSILSANFVENQPLSIMRRRMMMRTTRTTMTSRLIFQLRLAVTRVSLSPRARRERGKLATKTGSKKSRSFVFDSRHLLSNPVSCVRTTISLKSYFRRTMA